MKKLKSFIADFISAFPLKKSIIILSFSYAAFAALEVLAYFILFKWDQTLPKETLRIYFSVITAAISYGALVLAPQIIFEIYRNRKLNLMLKITPIPYKKIIKRYAIDFPQYNEFKIAPTSKGRRASISFMVLWIYLSVFILTFFILLRIADIEDVIALPTLTLTALTWGIPFSILTRLIGNYAVRKMFWGQVNPTSLEMSDTVLMQSTETASHKKTVFRLRILIICQMVFMLFVFLYLYYQINLLMLIIGTTSSVLAGILLILFASVIRCRKTEKEEAQKFTYTFRE